MTCRHHVHALHHRPFRHYLFYLTAASRVNFINRSAAIWLCYVLLCDRCSDVSSASARISVSTLTRDKLGSVRDSMTRSRNHCRRGNATVCSACAVELHFTSNNINVKFVDNTTMPVRRFYIASYSKIYFGLHVRCQISF
jgi:formate-dependent nitrite reductase cytochrome c552 subunit